MSRELSLYPASHEVIGKPDFRGLIDHLRTQHPQIEITLNLLFGVAGAEMDPTKHYSQRFERYEALWKVDPHDAKGRLISEMGAEEFRRVRYPLPPAVNTSIIRYPNPEPTKPAH